MTITIPINELKLARSFCEKTAKQVLLNIQLTKTNLGFQLIACTSFHLIEIQVKQENPFSFEKLYFSLDKVDKAIEFAKLNKLDFTELEVDPEPEMINYPDVIKVFPSYEQIKNSTCSHGLFNPKLLVDSFKALSSYLKNDIACIDFKFVGVDRAALITCKNIRILIMPCKS